MRVRSFTRREALGVLGTSRRGDVRPGNQDGASSVSTVAPVGELVSLLEFEEMARIALDAAGYAAIAGSDRTAFDRMSLRPRVLVKSSTLDLTTELFGERMFAPILVGATPDQRRFHPDGELGTIRGASAAQTTVVLSSQASYPLERIAGEGATALWYEVGTEEGGAAARTRAQQALNAGCKVLCISAQPGGAQPDWTTIDALRAEVEAPVMLSGVKTPDVAQMAMERGVRGVIVSSNGNGGGRAPIEALVPVVDALEGRIPVLVQGSFRRGTDVIKALALGATAVLLGRPPMWGLAAYGAEGVRTVLTMLQAELARTMINVGKPTLDMLGRDLVRVHSRATR